MNCPKCGNEINENQKFCSKCGTKLEQTENVPLEESMSKNTISEDMVFDNQNFKANEKNTLEETGVLGLFSNLNGLTKKIIIAVSCVILIAGAVFGVMQYKQYKKDIKGYKLILKDASLTMTPVTFKYDKRNKEIDIDYELIDVKAEDWQIECYKTNCSKNSELGFFVIKNKDDNPIAEIKYNDVYIKQGEPIVLKFKIQNQTLKDFKNFKNIVSKDNINSAQIKVTYGQQAYISPNADLRNAAKKWIDEEKRKEEKRKEIERKKKEWQEKVLSNCVYKTSDSVCFTTKAALAEPIKEKENTWESGAFNYWLGAKDTCESKGYKLPSDDDLRSLFSDILGIKIESGIEIKTYKDKNTTKIPTNYNVLRKIVSDEYNIKGTLPFWENEEFSEDTVYVRTKYTSWDDEIVEQIFSKKYSSGILTICVYDPNGSPHKSILQTKKEQEEAAKKEEQRRQLQQKQAIEDALF